MNGATPRELAELQGHKTLPLGAKYIGNIIDAKREGYGIYHQPDGISKVGVWEADKAKRVEEWIDGSKAA